MKTSKTVAKLLFVVGALVYLVGLWISCPLWICPYISRHLLSLNPLQARCRRYSRGER
ncbi:hypothetical protein ACEPHF_004303 [Escherichia coli]